MVVLCNTNKKLSIDDVEWSVTPQEEWASVRGNAMASGDDAHDQECEDEVLRKLGSGNQWAWCVVKVTGQFRGLEESDYLGCCSYESKEDFTQNSGYYCDMQSDILQRLQANVDGIVDWSQS
jgi:hypothetical protein